MMKKEKVLQAIEKYSNMYKEVELTNILYCSCCDKEFPLNKLENYYCFYDGVDKGEEDESILDQAEVFVYAICEECFKK